MEKVKIVVGYCRAGEANAAQIERQKKLLRQLAKEYELRISRFYIDNGYSGATLERPAFEQLLQDCRARKIGTVLITDTGRIARYMSMVAEALSVLGKHKVRVRLVEDSGLKFFWMIYQAITEPKS